MVIMTDEHYILIAHHQEAVAAAELVMVPANHYLA